ncbi:CfaE/CblD family pilus tip adhesin [Serratia fonticola]|uniref:CfaE/CblD family pilus tip adhesin n=1 Tax=Serratia fonticola TaxID=47917 RepID=UPI0014154249|nr:CfaE/CblD family pilus tip adhesin [Serratia fonticola]QIP94559.1 Alpha-fimbriae tip adhesin [Serratia fonticola]
MSNKSLKKLSIMLVGAILLLCFNIKTYAIDNKSCYVVGGGYSITYKANIKDIVANTQNDAVVGTIFSQATNFTCNQRSVFEWRLQVQPNAESMPGRPTICRTNIRGIGIQYLNYLGNPIECNSWDSILIIPEGNDYGSLKEGAILARIIRTNESLDNNGEYQLNLPSSLLAFYYGGSDSSSWGSISLQGARVYISAFHPQIIFPSNTYNRPFISLNIKKKYPGSNYSGTQDSANLDMCLYDGGDSTSKGIKLTFKDTTSVVSGRPSGFFSIFRSEGDNSQISNRIDYAVSVINPITGSRQEVKNGDEIYWEGTNTRRLLRQVILPNIPGVSLCVPAPITLSTPPLNISEKTAGNYFGTLTIIYTPST